MYTLFEKSLLSCCNLCPRQCGVNRIEGELGYCKSDGGLYISSICVHKGEEPVISGTKGICNVFFAHCNLQCNYCQNHEISDNNTSITKSSYSLTSIVERICSVLDYTENIVGFVSPSHFIPQMMAIIRLLREIGKNPAFVYNSNGYDSVESLKMLEGYIDVFLPDFKYMNASISKEYSDAMDYPDVVVIALKEMFRQKGSGIRLDANGIAEFGMIIRHLVLPANIENSIDVLKYIADELSVRCHISILAQYFPTPIVSNHPILCRTITSHEYKKVIEAFYNLGFTRGWLQDLESNENYRPDFSNELPFEANC